MMHARVIVRTAPVSSHFSELAAVLIGMQVLTTAPFSPHRYAPHRFRHTSPSSPQCSPACSSSPLRRPGWPAGRPVETPMEVPTTASVETPMEVPTTASVEAPTNLSVGSCNMGCSMPRTWTSSNTCPRANNNHRGGCNYLGYLPDGMLDNARGRESTSASRTPLAATQPPNVAIMAMSHFTEV